MCRNRFRLPVSRGTPSSRRLDVRGSFEPPVRERPDIRGVRALETLDDAFTGEKCVIEDSRLLLVQSTSAYCASLGPGEVSQYRKRGIAGMASQVEERAFDCGRKVVNLFVIPGGVCAGSVTEKSTAATLLTLGMQGKFQGGSSHGRSFPNSPADKAYTTLLQALFWVVVEAPVLSEHLTKDKRKACCAT